MNDVVVVAARRTPFGRFGGRLSGRTPIELGVAAAEAVLEGLNPAHVDQVIVGNVLSAGHGMNIARQIAVGSGLRQEVPAWTVNMMCGSGMQAAILAVQAIRGGEARAVLAGGVESMSQARLLIKRPAKGQVATADDAVDSLLRDGLLDSFSGRHMAETVEDLIDEYRITRQTQDAFAERSQRLTDEAQQAGRFTDELVTVDGLATDEHPRPGVTRASLATLQPLFQVTGTVTAGNASGVNDGAAMLLLADSDFASAQGWPVLAEWVDGVVAGCDPQRMGLGPVHAIRSLLSRTGRTMSQIDTLEINEAFAGQVLACCRELGLSIQEAVDGGIGRVALSSGPQLNPDGGAIAIGHPLATSGARLLTHLSWQVCRGAAQQPVAALCVGGGMGVAVMLSSVR